MNPAPISPGWALVAIALLWGLAGALDQVPAHDAERVAWVRRWYVNEIRARADRFRQALVAAYGPERGARIESAEAFEISEYGSPLDAQSRQRLFPFAP